MNASAPAAGFSGRVLLLAAALAVGGCITINIYFPAAAAEKAADRIIDEVLGKGNEAAPPK